MRRIWAHIIIAITTFVMMVVTFTAVTNRLNVGMDYASGKTLTFHVTEKTDNGESDPKEFGDNTLTDVVSIMEGRLTAAEVNSFDVAPFGKDLVKVTLYQDSVDYSQIKEYLTFNGSLALTDNAESTDYALFKDIMTDKAYYEPYNQFYPAVVIPIDNSPSSTFDTLL